MPIKLTSAAFEDGGYLPKKYASDGENVSPPLQWENVPDGARTLALILDDPDANGGPRVHWILFDLPADRRELEEHFPAKPSIPNGAKEGVSIRQARNDFDKIGYEGPVPDRNKPHRCWFTIYALNCVLHLPASCRKDDLLGAMHAHILDEGQLMVRYAG